MKKLLLIFLFLSLIVNCYAQSIAVEFRENDKFINIIGKVFYTGDTLEMVTFAEIEGLNGAVSPYAFIYKIIEKESVKENLYHIKCQNQLGVIASGTLDLTNYANPKITLITNRGMIITNISEEGKKFKKKYLPKIDIGK